MDDTSYPAPDFKPDIIKGEYRLPQKDLEIFLSDLRWEQNEWRFVADKEADYYDNKQLDSEVLQIMEERGIPPLVRNIISPTIDAILGMEAQNRRELKVIAETDEKESRQVALASDAKLKEAQRTSRSDRACSDAFKGQVSVGIGWVHVGRNLDPFMNRYLVENVHRREMFWDMRATKPDLSDARWIIRKKWFDQDVLSQVFPKFKAVIEHAGDLWSEFDYESFQGSPYYSASNLTTSYSQFINTTLENMEWLDSERRRMQLYEVWYRVYMRGKVLRYRDTVVEFDPKNPIHQEVRKSGGLVEDAVFKRVRLAYWVGPHQIADVPSPYPHNTIPYVPFFGMREDRTGIPYGLIRRMMSPQDEVNARLSKMMWILSAKRISGDEDAFAQPVEQVLEEASRPDAMLLWNPKRNNRNTEPKIETDFQLARDQYEVMQAAEDYVRHGAANTHPSFMGQNDSGVRSQTHSTQLIEQTTMGLAEIMDNFSYSRRLVGEQLLSLVQQDIGSRETQIPVTRNGKRTVITLNRMAEDPNGYTYRSNNIARTRVLVALEEVPKTQTYRQQQFTAMSEIVKSLSDDPEVQRTILDIWMRYSDLPEAEELANRISEVTGHGNMDVEDDPEAAARRQEKEAAQQQAAALEQAAVEADVRKTQAEAALTEGKVEELAAKIAKMIRDTGFDEASLNLERAKFEHEKEVDEKELAIKKTQAEKPQPAPASAPKKSADK